jgi:O-methyltransferase domain
MAERTAAYAPSVADTYDFSDIRTITDLGGSNGTLLVEILRRHRHLSGALFEIPTVAAHARAVLGATDLVESSTILAGDFFQSVPSADCYPTCWPTSSTTGTTAVPSPSWKTAAGPCPAPDGS